MTEQVTQKFREVEARVEAVCEGTEVLSGVRKQLFPPDITPPIRVIQV
ncbi:hypothetical protein H8K38_05950 [Undibacterium sp. FT79W]|nr:hypothetical protein [Undibacterium sp. FT79W]